MVNMNAKTIVILAFATSACAVAIKKTAKEEYGVGINLSFDYATISVQYPNRTIVDVATLNGNPAYREKMLHNIPYWFLDFGFQSIDEVLEQAPVFSAQDTLLERLQRFWPLRTRKDNALQSMYRALKIAGEAYLGSEIEQAVVTVPYDLDEEFQEQLAASAKAAHLEALFLPNHPAAEVASFAYGQGRGRRGPDQEFVTLAIDYNEACLSAVLTHEGDGFSERYGTIYNTTLGLRNEPEYKDLTDAMEHLTAAIPQELECPIISMALSGSAAHDRLMNTALQQTLRRYLQGCRKNSGEDAPDMDIDPVYAASRGGAEICAQQMIAGEGLDL